MTKQTSIEKLKLLTKEHYNKYPFQEPNEYALKRFIDNKNKIQDAVSLDEIKEPVIDVGCGTGKYTKLLEMAGIRNLVGVDISQNELKIARK